MKSKTSRLATIHYVAEFGVLYRYRAYFTVIHGVFVPSRLNGALRCAVKWAPVLVKATACRKFQKQYG